jgi:hypothetical protein
MDGQIVLSTAYLPPIEYLARIRESDSVLIEHEENYLKQSFRNRCIIMSSEKPLNLSVPVFLGSFHKTRISDIRIDYSKKWQHLHLRAITSAYGSSPFFIHYFDSLEKIILKDHKYLLDLNMELLEAMLEILRLERNIGYTINFTPANEEPGDFRYSISPKKISDYRPARYIRVFGDSDEFVEGLSIIDLIFNTGPEAASFMG